jgi:Flp pilus assembly protein TadD
MLSLACARDPQKLLSRGQQKIADGKFREAVIDLKNVVYLNPQLSRSHYYLGVAYASLGDFSRAKEVWFANIRRQ